MVFIWFTCWIPWCLSGDDSNLDICAGTSLIQRTSRLKWPHRFCWRRWPTCHTPTSHSASAWSTRHMYPFGAFSLSVAFWEIYMWQVLWMCVCVCVQIGVMETLRSWLEVHTSVPLWTDIFFFFFFCWVWILILLHCCSRNISIVPDGGPPPVIPNVILSELS